MASSVSVLSMSDALHLTSTYTPEYYSSSKDNAFISATPVRSPSVQSTPAQLVLRHGTDLHSPLEDVEATHTPTNDAPQTAKSSRSARDIALIIARNAHALPARYGDRSSLREARPITGLSSGLQQSGKTLGLGFYNGFTGIVTAPARGAVRGGPMGFAKGVVTGALGVVVKPMAATVEMAGLSIRGVQVEVGMRAAKKEARRAAAACDAVDRAEAMSTVSSSESGIIEREVDDAESFFSHSFLSLVDQDDGPSPPSYAESTEEAQETMRDDEKMDAKPAVATAVISSSPAGTPPDECPDYFAIPLEH